MAFPSKSAYWNTLGVACYRTSNWHEAISALENSVRLRQAEQPVDSLFIAMSKWQLGEYEAAEQCYERAIAKMTTDRPREREFPILFLEAAQMFGSGERANTEQR
jgi:uncharacterized protein HemY